MDWDDEAESTARSYAGSNFRDPRVVRRCPISMSFEEERDLGEFIAELTAILRRVPDEYRATAKAVFENGSYGSGDSFHIVYDELETSDEVADRVRRCWDYVQARRAADQAELERLKAKYEKHPTEPERS